MRQSNDHTPSGMPPVVVHIVPAIFCAKIELDLSSKTAAPRPSTLVTVMKTRPAQPAVGIEDSLLRNTHVRNFLKQYSQTQWVQAVRCACVYGVIMLRKNLGDKLLSISEMQAEISTDNLLILY